MKDLNKRLETLETKARQDAPEPVRFVVVLIDQDGNPLDGSDLSEKERETMIRLN